MKTGSCGVMQCLHTNSLMTVQTASNIRMELQCRLVQLPLQPHVLYILIFVFDQGAKKVQPAAVHQPELQFPYD